MSGRGLKVGSLFGKSKISDKENFEVQGINTDKCENGIRVVGKGSWKEREVGKF